VLKALEKQIMLGLQELQTLVKPSGAHQLGEAADFLAGFAWKAENASPTTIVLIMH
jgi:hypothetical protein